MMYTNKNNKERGAVSGLLVAVIALTVLVLGIGSFAIYAFVGLNEAQGDVDSKIAVAVAQAKEEKGEEDEAKFAEREKQPNTKFEAPGDYCGLTFLYPKTWSAHESEQLSNGGDFKAYLNPKVVPAISETTQFALRVTIEQRDYDQVIERYSNLIKKGTLKSSSTSSQGKSGQRLTGDFSKNIRGDAVIFRCRDKTITIRNDAEATFKKDFEAIIRTIDYNE